MFYGTVFPIPVTGKLLINQKSPFPFKREQWYAERWWLTPWLTVLPQHLCFSFEKVYALFRLFPLILHRCKAHRIAGQAEWWQFLKHWKLLKILSLKMNWATRQTSASILIKNKKTWSSKKAKPCMHLFILSWALSLVLNLQYFF